jgi:hypothetical protein
MARSFNPELPHFRIHILAEEEERFPKLLDMYAFLHDFNLLYEISRVATDPNYDNFTFPQLVRPRLEGLFTHLRDEDRLRVERMTKESPMELVTVLAAVPVAVGSIWGVVQILEKVVNFRLNRKKLREEVRKLERENAQPNNQLPPVDDAENSVFLFENPNFLESRLEERGAIEYYRMVSNRLVRAKIEIVEVRIDLMNSRTSSNIFHQSQDDI